MKRLWWRLWDQLRPRYVVGRDPAYKTDYGVAVVMQKHRDGTMRIVAVSVDNEESE